LRGNQDSRSWNQVNFTAYATPSNGANVSTYQFDFGDGRTQTVSSAATSVTVSHTYIDSNTFHARVTVNGTANGQAISHTQTACALTVKVVTPQAPTPPAPEAPTPAQPEALPNAGAGSILALFGGSAAIGTIAHRLLMKRRLSN
jgi:hypothetical protein